MPFETINLAATNDSLYGALSFATNHLPDSESGIDLLYDTYPELSSTDVDNRTIAATEVATAWWFASGAHYEALEHVRYVEVSAIAGREYST